MTDFTADAIPPTLRKPVAFRWRIRLSSEETAILAAAAIVGLSAAFLLFPGVDLAVSGLFHRTRDGFYLSHDPMLRALRKSSTLVMSLMLLAAVGRWIWRLLRRRKADLAGRRALFVIAGLALGTGLVVNGLFKDIWGRARPIDVRVFGGDELFTAAWLPSTACQSNCSFISGEGWARPGWWRPPWCWRRVAGGLSREGWPWPTPSACRPTASSSAAISCRTCCCRGR